MKEIDGMLVGRTDDPTMDNILSYVGDHVIICSNNSYEYDMYYNDNIGRFRAVSDEHAADVVNGERKPYNFSENVCLFPAQNSVVYESGFHEKGYVKGEVVDFFETDIGYRCIIELPWGDMHSETLDRTLDKMMDEVGCDEYEELVGEEVYIRERSGGYIWTREPYEEQMSHKFLEFVDKYAFDMVIPTQAFHLGLLLGGTLPAGIFAAVVSLFLWKALNRWVL